MEKRMNKEELVKLIESLKLNKKVESILKRKIKFITIIILCYTLDKTVILR